MAVHVPSPTGWTDIEDLIEAIRADLVDSRGWTERRDVTGTNKEIWVEKPSSDTVNGQTLLIGIKRFASDTLRINASHETWDTASASGANGFDDMVGQPMSNSAAAPNTLSPGEMPTVNKCAVDASSAVTILTPNDTTGVTTDHQYCYVVVNVDATETAVFGFGEMVQFDTWPTTAAGLFIHANYKGTTNANSRLFGQQGAPGATDQVCGYIYCPDLAGDNPWAVIAATPTASAGEPCHAVVGLSVNDLGEDHVLKSDFSGISARIPARFYANAVEESGTERLIPLGDYPDVFHVDVNDFTDFSTYTDGAEKFLVAPTRLTTSGRGVLLRNVGL